jgi:integrase
MRTKITLQAIKAAKPTGSRYVLWDSEVRGFGLRVNADGSKTYVLKYMIHGQQRWYSIGRHGSPWTPEQGRSHAIKLLGRIEEGADPAAVKKIDRAAGILIAELCDSYLAAAEMGQVISRRGAGKKASTLATDRGRIERHIKPLIGEKRVKDVVPADIVRLRDAIVAGKTAIDVKTKRRGRAIVKGGRGTATRTLGLLGGVFSYAVKQGYRKDNPVRGVERHKDQSCERYLSSCEIKRLGEVCAAAEQAHRDFLAAHVAWQAAGGRGPAPIVSSKAENPVGVAAIRMLLLTGMRKSEVLNLKWDWIDTERNVIDLPDSKSGKKAVPIGDAALSLLASIQPQAGNPYVFCGAKRGRPLVGLGKIWHRIRARTNLPGVRLHDLRHTFASFGAGSGTSLQVLGKILGHADTKTTARYAHLADDPLRFGANKISQGIADLFGGHNSL